MGNPITPLTPAEQAAQAAYTAKEGFVRRNLIALDMLGNVLTGGKPDETISSRSARAAERGSKVGIAMCKFLNLFNANHGPKAQCGDIERAREVEALEEQATGDQ